MRTQYVNRPSKAWPVDPAKYPLSGPSKGRVYVPQPRPSSGLVPGLVAGVVIIMGLAVLVYSALTLLFVLVFD